MLTMLMAFQAGLPPLDFGNIKGKKKARIFCRSSGGVGPKLRTDEKDVQRRDR
jgi:hypothetical protein